MKRKIIFSIMLLALTSMITMQSCKKEAPVDFTTHFAFTKPAIVAPANESTLHITGTTVDLNWTSTNESGDPVVADVYFGTSPTPPLFTAGVTAMTQTVTVELGATYYWNVIMKDANGLLTYGPTWSFTIFEPIGIFVGDFNADEPAEDYSYDVAFTKASATTLSTDNYWNSGWVAIFTLNFTANTYSMPLTTWGTYSGIEAGIVDPATGTMTGTYTIWHNTTIAEQGVHTYTKK